MGELNAKQLPPDVRVEPPQPRQLLPAFEEMFLEARGGWLAAVPADRPVLCARRERGMAQPNDRVILMTS